jgi:uncharacterized repeat protein (TIGR02543 family)
MKRAFWAILGLAAAALPVRGDYATFAIATHEAMGDYVRFESRSWAEGAEGEGGRLSANTTWSGGEHVILHDLYVPSGVTLTIGAGTVVKFREGTRIRVEDGGNLVLNGEFGNEVVLEGFEERTKFGGISLQSGAAGYGDNAYVVANGFTFGKYATIRLNDTTAFRGAGQALVPVNVSGSRDSAFSFDWVAEMNGVAFAGGTMSWSRVSDGTKNIVVPYPEGVENCESFTVRATTMRCCTPGKGACEVKLGEYLTEDISTHEAMAEFIAFESRDWAEGLEGEGGRLAANATWSGTHKIASDVYIPSGVTLTIAEDAVVEFCTGTRIKIEDGGTLNVAGADGHDVVFRGAEGAETFKGIVKMPNGTFADNSYVRAEGFTFSAFANVALHDASSFRSSGLALIPVTVSGSRSTAFSIDWEAESDGTVFRTGTLKWSNVSEGTKNISIAYGSELDGCTNFTLRVAAARACRASPDACTVKITDFITSDIAAHEAMADFIAFESRDWAEGLEGEGGRLAANATWSGTHKIASDVYIPSGVTLTLAADAVVEFCEGTRIKIEDGGTLNVVGADGHDVIFRGAEGATGYAGVVKMANGTYTDNMYVQHQGKAYPGYPNVSLHEATTYREAGKLYVAVTLGGSTRNQSFNIDWETDKGDRGTLAWASSSDGTKWIQIPVDAEKTGGTATHAISITAARGCNISSGRAVLTVLEPDWNATGRVSLAESGTDSGEFAVNGDIKLQPIFLDPVERVRYSGKWQGYDPDGAAALLVTLETDNGKSTLKEAPPSETGAFDLDLAQYPVGRYTLKHDILDAYGETLATMQKVFSIVDDEYVELHGGTLAQNETWTADKVHVVYQTVVVPSVHTIFIEPGAVVKFMTGTGIDISQGGAFFANGIVFTHINDDTVGGDTLSDGFTVAPPMDAYHLTGAFTFGDDTELRGITQNTALTGTISGKKTLSRGSTYRVSGTLTIADGGSLTIPPGTVLKMEDKAAIVVNSGGTLNAPGTRAAPIVITSIKDDTCSGDTNGDGSRTVPQPGDWDEIRNNGGTVAFANVTALYGGYGQYSNQGDAIIRTAGGTTTLDCCVVKHSDLRLLGRTGGTVRAENCILADGRWGIDGAVTFVNGVIADCNTGANGAALANTILWACDAYATGGTAANCVAFGGAETVPAGMVHADPLFIDPGNGDFRILEGSPCVDAADNGVAPEFDYFGQPRITLTEATATEPVGQLADIGICEVMPRDVASDIDLVPRNVRTTTNAVPGQLLFVKWEIANVGGGEVDAAWRDTVSLVSEFGREVVLGDKTTSSRIAIGGSVFCSGYFTVPAVAEGTWWPKVNVNSYHDIFEGALSANNALVGERAVQVELEAADPAVAREGVLNGGTPTVLKLRFGGSDANRMVKFSVPAGVKVTWGFGFMPQGISKSGGTTATGGTAVQFRVPDGETDVYVVLESDATATYALSTESTQLTIAGVAPAMLPSSGTTTLTITGAGFGETNAVSLAGAGGTVRLQEVARDDSGNLVATVDCATLKAGATYAVRVESDGRSAELPNAVTVTKAEGKGKLEARLIVPDSAREGRLSVGYVEYANVGSADMPAPVFRISGTSGTLVSLSNTLASAVQSVKLVGISGTYPRGVLKMGDSMRLPFYYVVKNGFGLSIEVMDAQSALPRDSVFRTWKAFSEAIETAATRLNAADAVVFDYSEIYNHAMSIGYGQQVGLIAGRLIDVNSDLPMPRETIWLFDTNENHVATCTTDKEGNFRFDSLVEGETYVVEGKTCQMEEVFAAGLFATGEIVYGAPFAKIECRIEGTGADAVRVFLVDENGETVEMSGSGGLFAADAIPDGNYVARVQIDGYHCVTDVCEYTVSAGTVANGARVLHAVDSGHANIRFVYADGNAASGVSCSLFNENSGAFHSSTSDAGGFALFNVPAGEYRVSVSDGHSLPEATTITVSRGTTVSFDVRVEETPFVLMPPMGAVPLAVTASIGDTNRMGGVTKCLWDFDGDGAWDSEGFESTNIYETAGVRSVSAKFIFSDGTEKTYTQTDAVDVWDCDVMELTDGTLLLDEASGYAITEKGEDFLVLEMTGDTLPIALSEGMRLVDPDDAIHPVSVKGFEAIDQFTLKVSVSASTLEKSFNTLRVSSLRNARKGLDLSRINGRVKFSIGPRGKFGQLSKNHYEVVFEGHGDFDAQIQFSENRLQKFSYSYGWGVSVDGKAGYATPKKGRSEPVYFLRKNAKKKEKRVIPGTSITLPVGYMPVRIVGYYFLKFDLHGEVKAAYSGRTTQSYSAGKGWSKSNLPGSFNVQLTGSGSVCGGVELEVGLGIGKDVRSKDYGFNLADLTAEFGLKAEAKCVWNTDEYKPDRMSAWAGPYFKLKGKIAHLKAGKLGDWSLASIDALSLEWKLWNWEWSTPMPDFSIGNLPNAEAELRFNNRMPVEFSSITSIGSNSTFKSRSWDLGGIHAGGAESVTRFFPCHPDDVVTYDIVLRETYAANHLLAQCIPTAAKARWKKLTVHGCKSDEEKTPYIEVADHKGTIPRSCDPNEMSGPLGIGERRLVAPGEWATYTIYFENKTNATAAAQEVYVSDALSEHLDWSTFEMCEAVFGEQVDLGLAGKKNGTSDAPVDGTDYTVRTQLSLDETTGLAVWYMRIVDPATETGWPTNIVAGFLPPNDPETHCGEGHITYRVKVREDAVPGARIDAAATIVFDYNEPIVTDPAWWNTVSAKGRISFDANGGSGEMEAVAIALDGKVEFPANTFTHDNFAFTGWGFAAAGPVAYPDGWSGILTNAQGLVLGPGESLSLFAQWKLLAYTVKFNANGGTGSMANQKIERDVTAKLRANAFKRSGFTFLGWSKSKTGAVAYKNAANVKNLASAGGSATLYAQWAKNAYKVAFNANGGTLPEGKKMAAQAMTYGKAAKLRKNAFTRKNFTFMGWAKTKNGAVAYANAAAVKNLRTDGKTTTLYARWAKTKYTVAFNANGGTGKMANQTMTYNKAAKLTKNAFKRSGWTFLGWATSKTGAVVYKNAAEVKKLRTDGKTTTLYAKWAKNSYKVAFSANGGTGKMTAQAMTYGKAANLKKNAFKRTGYTFAGWAKTKTGAVAYKNAASVKNLRSDGGTQTLFAKWTPTTYKVAFNANGGTGTMAAQSVKYGATAKLRANAFTRTGFTFQGWGKTATGGKAYSDKQAVKNLRSDGGTTTLYALWAANSRTETASGVPYAWLAGYGLGDGTATGYETAANAKAANGVNTVWECYVAGLDPMDENAAFTAALSFDGDGNPVVSSAPDLGGERAYTVEGVENLGDAWGPTNSTTRFFRVKVGLRGE